METSEQVLAAARSFQRTQYRRAASARAEADRLAVVALRLDADAAMAGEAEAELKVAMAEASRRLSARYGELAGAHTEVARFAGGLIREYQAAQLAA